VAISLEQATAAAELVALGMSQRQVALAVGISRGTVGTIAANRWKGRQKAERPDEPELGPLGRCHQCGRRISLPCKACRDEAARVQGSGFGNHPSSFILHPSSFADDGPLELELKPGERERYLEIRRSPEDTFPGRAGEAMPERPLPKKPPPKHGAGKLFPTIQDVLDAFEM